MATHAHLEFKIRTTIAYKLLVFISKYIKSPRFYKTFGNCVLLKTYVNGKISSKIKVKDLDLF